MIKYDAIIIGSGQAGNPLAKKLAATGRKVAIIERGFIGGTCVNVGCTPTKTLIASGRVAHLLNRSADFGIHACLPTVPPQAGIASQAAIPGQPAVRPQFASAGPPAQSTLPAPAPKPAGIPQAAVSPQVTVSSGASVFPQVAVDIQAVITRKNTIVTQSRESNTKSLLETPNLDVVFGHASFSGYKQITVVGEDGAITRMTADWIFINAGTRPTVPAIRGLDAIHYYDSTTLQDLLEIPQHLVIIGGSYIALEFGQLYRRLGSQVTIIETGSHFLPKEDEDIAGEIRTILTDEGLNILTGHAIHEIRQEEAGGIVLELSAEGTGPSAGDRDRSTGGHEGSASGPAHSSDSPDRSTSGGEASSVSLAIKATHVLVATGREANTAALQPGASGIALDEHGFVRVNDRLETNVPGVYALGDVKGGPEFTHIAYNDHLIVYKNLIQGGDETISGRAQIYCLFTDPELGRIGITERQAREKNIPVKIASMPVTHIARAIENGETRGLVKAVVHAETRQILGVAALAPGGGELMSILQMAMVGGITVDRIRDMVFAHPTFAEALNNLFAQL